MEGEACRAGGCDEAKSRHLWDSSEKVRGQAPGVNEAHARHLRHRAAALVDEGDGVAVDVGRRGARRVRLRLGEIAISAGTSAARR